MHLIYDYGINRLQAKRKNNLKYVAHNKQIGTTVRFG